MMMISMSELDCPTIHSLLSRCVQIPHLCSCKGQYQFSSISESSLLHIMAVCANLIVLSVAASGMLHEI
jgi:hypothetical protein